MKKHSYFTIILAFFLLSSGLKAQYFALDPEYYRIFDKDSLVGFDESAARATAISGGFLGLEYKVKMHDLKREFIIEKYNLPRPTINYVTIEEYLNSNRPAAIPGCVNEDFEASTPGPITNSTQVTGWVVTKGFNGSIPNPPPTSNTLAPYFPTGIPSGANSCNLFGCCPAPPMHSEIIDCSVPGGYIDAQIGNQYPIYSVFGSGAANPAAAAANPQITNGQFFGDKVLRLNDGVTGDRSIERLSKTFSVSSSNALFQFAFISVFSPNHDCCSAGGFIIRLSNATTNSVLPCPVFSVSAPGPQCTATVPIVYKVGLSGVTYTGTGQTIYNTWKINSLDLTAYIGQNITLDIVVSDCTAGGHFGKVYFDAQCGPMTVYGNGNPYDAGTNVTVPTCGAAGATICAADGLGPYSWAGPGLAPGYSTPSMTNQCIVTSSSSQYTLYMQPEGSCAPIQRIVNSTVTPAPLLAASVAQAQCGSTLAIVTLTPSGSAANPSVLQWFPTPMSLNSTTTQGTYTIPVGPTPNTVAIVASDPLGCKVTATVNINPAPPIPTFAIVNTTNSNSITCDYQSINLDAVSSYSYNGNGLNYFWASASSTFSAPSISVVSPGTFTVNGSDPVTNCIVTHTIAIGINTIAPVSSVSPSFQTITCGTLGVSAQNITVTANPTVNITHQILSEYGGAFSANTFSASYMPGGVGTFTYILKNDVNGCITQKEFTVTSNQGFPVFSLTSPDNYTLGCTSTSCAILNINNGNTTPAGGAISYSLLAPGASSVTQPGPLSAAQTYTVCSPGTYTVITKDNLSECETRVPVSILQNTIQPSVIVTYDRQILDCNNTKVVLKGSSFTSSVDYLWNFINTSGPNSLQSDTITAYNIPANTTQTLVNTYTLTVNDISSTCKSQTVIPIYQNLYKPKSIVAKSIDAITCITNTVVLTNQSSTGIPNNSIFTTSENVVGFLWQGPSPQKPSSFATTYTAATTGIYTLTVKDLNNGCINTVTTSIGDNRVYPDIAIEDPFILDCGSGQVTLTVAVANAQSNQTYTWSAPSVAAGIPTLATFPVSEPGEYSLIVKFPTNGCARSVPYTVTNGTLTADFEPEVTSGFAPITINFNNKSTSTTGTNNITSVWNFGNNSSKTYSTGITASNLYTSPGTYTVTLYATKGSCQSSKQKVVKIDIPSTLEIPNVFTPNNDGTNDLFFVKATNLSEISVLIFDRWGHKVYELTSTTGNIEWDGKNMLGKESAEGVYFYTIKATGKDGISYDKKGTVNLYR